MEPEEGKLSVWVCREEKLVSGVSKRTTCADVVKVLLEDQNVQQGASASMLSGSPQSYCVVEKWRGFERILPNKTKILRLWSAWGDEQENVRFVLVKNEASLPNNGPRSAEARVVQSKDSSSPASGGVLKGSARACWSTAAGANLSQQDKQRRIVRKAFRKLDKMNKKREETTVSKDKVSMEKMETLVHLVISQDHTIRQQIQRIKELDKEIERYEAKVHFDRIKRHGVNYVQDTYMVEVSAELQAFSDCKRKAGWREARGATAEALAQFEEYARRCEEMVRLEEELAEREALVESITGQLQEELNQRWMRRRREEPGGREAEGPGGSADVAMSVAAVAAAASGLRAGPPPAEADAAGLSESDLAMEEERIKTQLDTSLYIGLRLNTDLQAVKGDLDLSLEKWEAKEKELLDLLARAETLEAERLHKDPGAGEVCGAGPAAAAVAAAAVTAAVAPEAQVSSAPSAAEKSGGWVEQARGLASTCNVNDDDSDTGLSSMHSQDSDNTPVCESLV